MYIHRDADSCVLCCTALYRYSNLLIDREVHRMEEKRREEKSKTTQRRAALKPTQRLPPPLYATTPIRLLMAKSANVGKSSLVSSPGICSPLAIQCTFIFG